MGTHTSRTTIVPRTRGGRIEFYGAHVGVWAARAAAIGIDPARVAAIAAAVEAAKEAQAAHRLAQQAAMAATQRYANAVRDLHDAPGMGADTIETIKAFARSSDGPDDPDGTSVYVLAQIPAPQKPSAAPPPGTPREFVTRLLPMGEVELRWKCDNPAGTQGTMYEVRRALGTTRDFQFLGVSGTKRFVDATLPSGAGTVQYLVTAFRSTARGNAGLFTLNLGVSGGVDASVAAARGTGQSRPPMKAAA